MSHTIDVLCPMCDGTGDTDGRVCQYCLGQRHIAVDKDERGYPPVGYREWVVDYRRGRDGSTEK